jgi:hypothetical protein
MTQRIFLSSICVDLVNLRSGLKESLEEVEYEVWASENCLRDVEQADLYLPIVNSRYSPRYEARLRPLGPFVSSAFICVYLRLEWVVANYEKLSGRFISRR